MPLNNLAGTHFSDAERTQIFDLFNQIKQIAESKMVQLSADEKQRYSAIRNHNKNAVDKVKSYYERDPSNSAPEVNWNEYLADYSDREFLLELYNNMNNFLKDVDSTRILHDHDIYRAALADYDYTKYRAKRGITSAIGKAADLKQYFYFPSTSRRRNNETTEEESNTEEAS